MGSCDAGRPSLDGRRRPNRFGSIKRTELANVCAAHFGDLPTPLRRGLCAGSSPFAPGRELPAPRRIGSHVWPLALTSLTIEGPDTASVVIRGKLRRAVVPKGSTPVGAFVINAGAIVNISGVTIHNGQRGVRAVLNLGQLTLIGSRSANARYRPAGGGAERLRCDAAMPPASRNHRVPTAGGGAPRRRPTEGRPGERSVARPARSERRRRLVIATTSRAMLRRPVEFTQYASTEYQAALAHHGITVSMSRRGDCRDNAAAESFFATLKIALVHDAR